MRRASQLRPNASDLSNRPEVELALYPADTLTQARAFYVRHNAIAGIRELCSRPCWHARPNFHCGSFQRGFCWTCNQRDIHEYTALWVRRIDREAAVRRPDWDRFRWRTHAGSDDARDVAAQRGPDGDSGRLE